MAEAMKIYASQVEGLEDVLTEIVRKEIVRHPPREDMEELKRSPAGTMIRLEEQVQALTNITKIEFQKIDEHFELIEKRFEGIDRRFEKIDERFEKIESQMVTKEEFTDESKRVQQQFDKIDELLENMVTKEEFADESKRVQQQFDKIDEHFEKVETRIEQNDKNIQNLSKIVETLVVKVDEQSKTLSVKIDEQDKRLSLFQKVTYAFFIVFSGTLIAILILLIKQP